MNPSSNATLRECIKQFFESIKILCNPELVSGSHASLLKNKMLNIVDFIKSLFVKRFSMTYLTKTIAFTLAETLVVMGIIGVVAALTIPNLNQSTGDREKVAKVKKIYANLEDALGRATAVYDPVDEWFINDSSSKEINDRFAERITEFMKISKTCGEGVEGCIPSEFKGLDGVLVNGIAPEDLNFLLADGTGLVFELNSSNCTKDFGATSDSPLKQTCGQIYADINGIKGANTYGKDYFVFYVTKSGVFPTGGKNSKNTNTLANLKLNCLTTGVECAGWVIENGNMDYLKCPNELD